MTLHLNRVTFILSTLFGCSLFANSIIVFAQDDFYLEEITVTAQKREQSMQDVPVAVTAWSGDKLIDYGVTDVFDLQQTAPGLVVDNSQDLTTSNFAIRGIGTSGQNFGLEPSVGLYVDGVYRSRQGALVNELVDIEQVEVLRGPQGTLFGRNSSSGAVLINTVAPSHETGGFFELTYGNLDLFTANGAFGGSLVEDVLAVRVTGFTTNRDGHVDAVGLGDDVINDRDRKGGRAQFLFTPTADLSLRVNLDYAEIDETCCSAGTFLNNYFGYNNVPGSDSLLTLLGVPIISDQQFSDDVVGLNTLPSSKHKDKGVSAELNWDTAAGKFTSITAFRSFNSADVADVDFTLGDIVSRDNRAESDTFSQEIRFSNSGERIEYLVGGYYYTQDLDNRTSLISGPLFAPFTLSDPNLSPLVNGINSLSAALAPLSQLTGGLVPALPMVANPFPAGSSAQDMMMQEHEAWALFGQLDFSLTEQFKLSAGLRYTDENKELQGSFTQGNTGPPLGDLNQVGASLVQLGQTLASLSGQPFNPALLPALLQSINPHIQRLSPFFFPGWGYYLLPILSPRPGVDETLNDDRITWNVKFSWLPNDDMLVYAGYSTGFKSGGTNTDRIDPSLDQLFGAEKTQAFEAGIKADFPEQHLRANLALHYTIVDDFQSIAFTGTGFNLRNAGQLESKGGELELTWQPLPNLVLNGAYIYNEAEYDSFKGANCWVATPFHTGQLDPGLQADGSCDHSGGRVSGNAENTLIVSATGVYPLGATVEGYLHADYSYRSSVMMDGNFDPLKLQDGFGLLNMRAGLILQGLDLDITFWARNLLDKNYHGVVFDAPLQDGRLASYLREPRTFGVTVRKTF